MRLLPEQIASKIILVGDPDRVTNVSKHFDRIDHEVSNREFRTRTGNLGNERLSVVSTGIGTDNIDIVLNELDALVNIDLQDRRIKQEKTSLEIVRVGTCGALQEDVEPGSFVISTHTLGLDGLLHFYQRNEDDVETALENGFIDHLSNDSLGVLPYSSSSNMELVSRLNQGMIEGITLTCLGFYGPQGRQIRLKIADPKFFDKIKSFSFKGLRIENIEMETSGILGLGKLLGHQCTSCSVALANRSKGSFSNKPDAQIEKLIRQVLDKF